MTNNELLLNLAQYERIPASAFFDLMPGVPEQTVYSRIRALVKSGTLQTVGRGVYEFGRKVPFVVPVNDMMISINAFLTGEFVGMPLCIFECGKNLRVEVPRAHLSNVFSRMKKNFNNVFSYSEVKEIADRLSGCIIVSPLVSDAPCTSIEGTRVPTLEKHLVDYLIDGSHREEDRHMMFQKSFEAHSVNRNRLRRYARRRGVEDEVEHQLAILDWKRISIVSKIQSFFAEKPVDKAWIFGSFSRCEERPESDVDILVSFDRNGDVGILEHAAMTLALENAIGREVDLVTEGTLLSYAQTSADADKYLIYERGSSR